MRGRLPFILLITVQYVSAHWHGKVAEMEFCGNCMLPLRRAPELEGAKCRASKSPGNARKLLMPSGAVPTMASLNGMGARECDP